MCLLSELTLRSCPDRDKNPNRHREAGSRCLLHIAALDGPFPCKHSTQSPQECLYPDQEFDDRDHNLSTYVLKAPTEFRKIDERQWGEGGGAESGEALHKTHLTGEGPPCQGSPGTIPPPPPSFMGKRVHLKRPLTCGFRERGYQLPSQREQVTLKEQATGLHSGNRASTSLRTVSTPRATAQNLPLSLAWTASQLRERRGHRLISTAVSTEEIVVGFFLIPG